MSRLSNTAVPKYYGAFREAVYRGDIPVCREILMEMDRIDGLIANPNIYYDPDKTEGWIEFCESELTLTDGSDFHMLDSFKLWGEQIYGWYYFIERSVWQPDPSGRGGHYVTRKIKKRLVNKQYLIVGRGAAKSLYDTCIHAYEENVDTSTTHQITTAPTMRQANEVLAPYKTAIIRARGPVFQFLTEGSLQNTTGSKASGSYTPAGDVSKPTFTGEEMTSSGSFTPAGSVAAPTFTGTEGDVSAKGTPTGTVSKPTFTGDPMTSSGNFTPEGTIEMGVDAQGVANYTPAGNVSKPKARK